MRPSERGAEVGARRSGRRAGTSGLRRLRSAPSAPPLRPCPAFAPSCSDLCSALRGQLAAERYQNAERGTGQTHKGPYKTAERFSSRERRRGLAFCFQLGPEPILEHQGPYKQGPKRPSQMPSSCFVDRPRSHWEEMRFVPLGLNSSRGSQKFFLTNPCPARCFL